MTGRTDDLLSKIWCAIMAALGITMSGGSPAPAGPTSMGIHVINDGDTLDLNIYSNLISFTVMVESGTADVVLLSNPVQSVPAGFSPRWESAFPSRRLNTGGSTNGITAVGGTTVVVVTYM